MPGSLAAGAIALALVPGYAFLVLTRKVRQPREQTALQEVLEVVLVGLFTTGSVVIGAVLVWAGGYSDPLTVAGGSDAALRAGAWHAVGTLAVALLIAIVAGMTVRTSVPRTYQSNVWADILGDRKDGQRRHVTVELADGRVFDGPLKSYTSLPLADGTRQVAMEAPIRVTKKGARKPIELDWKMMVIDSSDLVYVVVDHIADPKQVTG